MKTLNETQKNMIISSCLNAGMTMQQAEQRIKSKEEKLNKPKKQSFNWSNFDEENDSGIM